VLTLILLLVAAALIVGAWFAITKIRGAIEKRVGGRIFGPPPQTTVSPR